MEYSLQWLMRIVAVVFIDETVAACLELFLRTGLIWIQKALPRGQVLHPMWLTEDGFRWLSDKNRSQLRRWRGRLTAGHCVIAPFLSDLVPLTGTDPATAAEYHHLLSDPRLIWNLADLGLFANDALLPRSGLGFDQQGFHYPKEVRVQFGPLQIDPLSYWDDVALMNVCYPLIPEESFVSALPPAIVDGPLEAPAVPSVVVSSSSSSSVCELLTNTIFEPFICFLYIDLFVNYFLLFGSL